MMTLICLVFLSLWSALIVAALRERVRRIERRTRLAQYLKLSGQVQ